MNALARIPVSFLLLLVLLLPVAAVASDTLSEADRLEHWNASRYDISAPAFCGGDAGLTVKTRYESDPQNTNAMLLELLILDQDGKKAFIANNTPRIYLPYPPGHDAAMGYEYKIEKLDTGSVIDRDTFIDPAIAFNPDRTSPYGTYRISWDKMTPKAAAWDLVMTKMDWEAASCQYTVGAGNKKIKVERQGDNVTISGGEIAGGVLLVNVFEGIDDYQQLLGWHTESGHYTFHNVILDDITIHAHQGENYKVTLDASVKGSYSLYCDLRNGANLHLVNNDIIYSDHDYSVRVFADTSCNMTLTGNGKILVGNGLLFREDLGMDVPDESAVFVALTSKAPNMDDSTIHTNEEALADIKAFEGRVVISADQVQKAKDFPPVRSVCDNFYSFDYGYTPVIDPVTGEGYTLDNDYIVKNLRPAKGAMTEPIITCEADLDEGALYRPLLLSGHDGDHFLRSQITQQDDGQSIRYEIHMVNADDDELALDRQCSLYIPYPEGMDMESAAKYDVTIHHAGDSGDEVFSSKDGSISLTPYGFCIPVRSLSPFQLHYDLSQANIEPEDLPETGDPSQLALYVSLLALSLVMIIRLIKRSRQV